MIDIEAIGWAYRKLLAYGVQGGSMDSAMMMDRLKSMFESQPEPVYCTDCPTPIPCNNKQHCIKEWVKRNAISPEPK